MASHITRYILEQWKKQDAQRTTQGKTPPFKKCQRLRLPYHSPTPQIFDRLELLDQQLNYALPVGIISQAIITTDNYLGYSLSHYLFPENLPLHSAH